MARKRPAPKPSMLFGHYIESALQRYSYRWTISPHPPPPPAHCSVTCKAQYVLWTLSCQHGVNFCISFETSDNHCTLPCIAARQSSSRQSRYYQDDMCLRDNSFMSRIGLQMILYRGPSFQPNFVPDASCQPPSGVNAFNPSPGALTPSFAESGPQAVVLPHFGTTLYNPE